jgi:hypothetical protein
VEIRVKANVDHHQKFGTEITLIYLGETTKSVVMRACFGGQANCYTQMITTHVK